MPPRWWQMRTKVIIFSEAGKTLVSLQTQPITTCSDVVDIYQASTRWDDFKPVKMTVDLRKELRVIEARGYLDPKKFFRNGKRKQRKLVTNVQVRPFKTLHPIIDGQ